MRESILNIKCSPEAREKCPFDHPCDSDDKAYFEEGSACDIFNKKLIPPPPPTNADHIRSMTDEELAVMFAMIRADLTRLDRSVRPYSGRDVNENYDWLKQPYKEG